MSVGLAIVRIQPLHEGHTRIFNRMIQDNDVVIVGIGSAGESRTTRNPWTVEERQQMLRNVYGDRIKIVPFSDIGSEQTSTQWVDFVLAKLKKVGLPDPTRYYTGSEADAIWYKDRFYNRELSKPLSNSRRDEQYYVGDRFRVLYNLNRYEMTIPSATEIRTMLETRSDRWKKYVPEVNHSLVESTYPEEFRVRLTD